MSKRQSAITRCALLMLVGLLPLKTVRAQTNTPTETFLIKGVVSDANGPLIGKILLVFPISAELGKPVTRQVQRQVGVGTFAVDATLGVEGARNPKTGKWTYTYRMGDDIGDAARGPRLNPQTTTDAKGTFSVNVPRNLFKETPDCAHGCTGYKAGELGLGVFNGLLTSSEIEIIKYDVNASTVDVGRIVFKPVRDQGW
ncbi:MAG: hypothetical protein LAO31_01355 [Acidobacteriia bacterium]|nr:hypothetical protein [Terriglobia bacterium]